MNRYTRLPLLALGLLLAAGCSDLFHEEELDGMRPDDRVGDLVATRAVEEGTDTMHFPTGSLYRLFAFTKTYDEAAPDTYDPATMLRFDQLASEQETGEANHKYIKVANVNIDFSFNPSNDREKADDPSAKRTIDFYGFTYDGENHYPAKDTKENFVPLKRTAGASADGDDPASYYYETPDLSKQDGNGFPKDSLRDLMWGRLLNQNVKTALPHCHIPFQHVFSQLTFEVMQQENPDEKGKGLYDISIADITLTNIYRQGQVNLQTGRLTVTGAPCTTRIHPDVPELLTSPIPVTSSRFSTSLVFPTHGDSYDLASGITAPGGNETYALQAQVTLRGDKYVLNRFAMKAYGNIDKVVPVPNKKDTATLVLPPFELPRTVQSADEPGETKLYLRAGYSYTVRISFLEYGVFIVTQIPQKVRWIHGEGKENGVGDGSDGVFDYQQLATGNPVYFGGSMWMDRNLGAEEWDASDPETDPDRLQGYYYQPGRNVPYWPFYQYGYNSSTPLPTWRDRWKVPLVNSEGSGYPNGKMRFFPSCLITWLRPHGPSGISSLNPALRLCGNGERVISWPITSMPPTRLWRRKCTTSGRREEPIARPTCVPPSIPGNVGRMVPRSSLCLPDGGFPPWTNTCKSILPVPLPETMPLCPALQAVPVSGMMEVIKLNCGMILSCVSAFPFTDRA